MKILFVRLSAIGDVIQAAAALQLYRNAHPEVKIYWAVDRAVATLVSAFGVVDHVIAVDADGLFKGSLVSRLSSLWKSMRQIAAHGAFDVVYTAHPDWRFGLLARLVKSNKRVSPKSLPRSRGYILDRNRTFEYYRLLTDQDSGSLKVDAALAVLGANALSSQSKADLQRFGLPGGYIALVPGGARNMLRDNPQRRWPIENYVGLAERLSQKYPVVLLGGPDDRWVSKHFSSLQVVDLIGLTSLLDTVSLLDQAQCVVAHDSGPIHLASITSAPLVGIFGPTPANAVLSSSRARTVVLQPENRVACSPCYDGRGYAACDANICMQATLVESVVAAVTSLVDS